MAHETLALLQHVPNCDRCGSAGSCCPSTPVHTRQIILRIIFRQLDNAIAQSVWYKTNRSLKAQTVAYTIAECAQAFRDQGNQIDLLRIWKDQEVPAPFLNWLMEQANTIHEILNSPPGSVKNPAEFCRREFCWTLYVRGKVVVSAPVIREYGVSLDMFSEEQLVGRRDARRNDKLDFEITLAKLVPRAREIRSMAEAKRLISANNTRALDKLESGRLSFTKTDKNALKNLLERLGIET